MHTKPNYGNARLFVSLKQLTFITQTIYCIFFPKQLKNTANKRYMSLESKVSVDHCVKQRTKLHLLYFVQVCTLKGVTKQLTSMSF